MNSKWLSSLCAVWMVGVGLTGCGSTQNTDEEAEQEVVGKPPSKTDDPYYVMNMPEEAESAESSGYIGSEKNESGEEPETVDEPGAASGSTSEAEPTREGDTKTADGSDSETKDISGSVSNQGKDDSKPVRVSKAEPPEKKRREKRDEMSEGRGVQCYSCVRICPLTEKGGGDPDCSAGDRDVICGWGMHSEKTSARELAAAECNGALEMARDMKQWSRIEGECPPPTCRSGGAGR